MFKINSTYVIIIIIINILLLILYCFLSSFFVLIFNSSTSCLNFFANTKNTVSLISLFYIVKNINISEYAIIFTLNHSKTHILIEIYRDRNL